MEVLAPPQDGKLNVALVMQLGSSHDLATKPPEVVLCNRTEEAATTPNCGYGVRIETPGSIEDPDWFKNTAPLLMVDPTVKAQGFNPKSTVLS